MHPPPSFPDLDDLRDLIIEDTWEGAGLPTDTPTVTANYSGTNLRSSYPNGASRCDKLVCPWPRGALAEVHLLYPPNGVTPLGRLAVVCSGHSDHYYSDLSTGMNLISLGLLSAGFHVLGCGMPAMGFNPATLVMDKVGGGTMEFTDHIFDEAEADGVKPLRLFLDHIIIAIRHAIATLSPLSVDVTGLSGGGWTANWLAAVYRVIRRSAPVMDSLPFPLREPTGPGDAGDWEQFAARQFWYPLVRMSTFGLHEALYALAGAGMVQGESGEDTGALELHRPRKRLQILGDDDPVFPAATIHDEIERYSQNVALYSQSESTAIYDTTNDGEHTYTAWSVAQVVALFSAA